MPPRSSDFVGEAGAAAERLAHAPGRRGAATLDELVELLDPDDAVIDGGNSYYRDDITRADQLAPQRIHYLDCGTSGGVWGLERGYCLMIGGAPEPVARLDPIFRTIAPGQGLRRAHPGQDPDRTGPLPTAICTAGRAAPGTS